MLERTEMQGGQQEDEKFRKELEKRQPEIQETAGSWRSLAFGISWLLAMIGWGIIAAREHGSKTSFGVIMAILLGAGVVYAEAERFVMSRVSDDIQGEIDSRGRE